MISVLENENEIIRRCQAGDLNAFKNIYHHFEQPMLGMAIRMLENQSDAEDAIQVAFMKLYQGISKYRFDAKFSTYLFRIVMNVCLDALKKRKIQTDLTLVENETSYKPMNDLRMQLEEAINKLPERMKACFVMFAVEEFPQAEIAEVLGLSVGAVKAQVFHAKARLRSLLSDASTGAAI